VAGERSIAFDRAAEYYDRTRRMTPEAREQTIAMLAGALRGKGRVLEVGVGTGQIALPLDAVGVRMVGIDLSRPMLAKLIEKTGGRSPFPLTIGDATALPFRDASFGGVVARHVLHLIPDFRTAVAEIARVSRPGGVALVSVGWRSEVSEELEEVLAGTTERARHVGLDPHDVDLLDGVFAERGGVARQLDPIVQRGPDTLRDYIESIEDNLWSWTWRLSGAERERMVERLRAWAQRRGLGPDDVVDPELTTRWRAYDLPG
jgi:ubiquinone/menaquinone biosynthesis C-methylase UbiE